MSDHKPNVDPSIKSQPSTESRRAFLKNSSTAVMSVGLASSLLVPKLVHAQGKNAETLKIGLIGCGGRGSGAALNAINADDNCQLVALADAFEDQLQEHRTTLAKNGDRLVVAEATVGKAFVLKRWKARARGRAGKILKPYSDVRITLREESI